MGYYVHTTDVDFDIQPDKLDTAYKALCDLNWRNDLKHGGRYPRPENIEGPHPDVWFSWMDWNYHEVCKDVFEVLKNVGFEVYGDKETGFTLGAYHSKSGCEEDFIRALAPFADEGSVIAWQGENNEDMYRWVFRGGQMIKQHAEITWVDND